MLRLLAIVGVLAAMAARLPGSPSDDAATIVDSGSTNRSGFRIVVDQTGAAEMTMVPRGVRRKTSPAAAGPASAAAGAGR